MIAAGIDRGLHTTSVVRIVVGPAGITACYSETMPTSEFDPRDIKADMIGVDRWNCGCCNFWPQTQLVPVPMGRSKRDPLRDRYETMRPAFMADCPREAGLNAFVAAFGTDW